MTSKNNHLIKKDSDLKIYLKKIDFESIEFDEENFNDSGLEIKLKSLDEYEIENFNEENISIEFKRKIHFEPEVIYKLTVILCIVYDINENSNKKLDKSILQTELDKRRDQLLSPVIKKASLLVSNITNNTDDDLLMITPPFFQEKKQTTEYKRN